MIATDKVIKVLCREDFGAFHANCWYDANLSKDGRTIFVILNVRNTYNFGRWFNLDSSEYMLFFSNDFYTLSESRKFKIKEINSRI